MINKYHLRIILALHQIIGSIIGFILVSKSIFELDFIHILFFFILIIFSLVCGFFSYKNSKYWVEFASLNYALSVIDFGIFDFISFQYNLPLTFNFVFDFDTLNLSVCFFSLTNLYFEFPYSASNYVSINIVSCIILWVLQTENGINKNLFNYDIGG